MNNNLIKYYLVVFCFCATLGLFAQPSSTGDGNGGLEGTDAAPASIDDYVWAMVLIGLLYVFIKFKNIQKADFITKVKL